MEPPVFTVSQFIGQINEVIIGDFVVEGEITDYSVSQQKWIFFTLKDDRSSLNCFATVFAVRTPLADGLTVRVRGYPKVHERSGRFSLVVQRVELVGEGALARAYEFLKQQLTREGLFAPERKRPLPTLSSRVGVIASRESAAWGDFKRIIANRWGGVEIVLRHSLVQGEGAAEDIVQAFQEFNAATESYDALVLIRGGGSLADLAAFNSEEVVRAVYASRIPVVVGVGHERDETLADFAADVRASTPSNAAELLVPERTDFLRGLTADAELIESRLEYALLRYRQQVEHSAAVVAASCENMLWPVRTLTERFPEFLEKLRSDQVIYRDRVEAAARLLGSFDPRQVVGRGYSITRTAAGAVVRDARSVDSGESLVIELSRGTVHAVVE